jgi:signal transduction histidine kinase
MNLSPSKPAPHPSYHDLRSVIRQLHESTEAHQIALHRALHDQLGGLIVSAAMDLSAAVRTLGASGLVDFRLARAQSSMVAAIDLERELSEDLRPSLLDNIGLFAALRWYVRHGCPHSSVVCSEHFPGEEMSLSSVAVTTLYRIGQESLALAFNEPDLKSVDLDVSVDNPVLQLSVAHEHQGGESVDPFDATPGLTHSLLERTRSMAGEMLICRTPTGTALVHRFKLELLK